MSDADWYWENNICPWCGEKVTVTTHELGYPDPLPDDQISPYAKRLKWFCENVIYTGALVALIEQDGKDEPH